MKELIVRVFDDLDYARDRVKNEAAVTLTIGLDGTWTELDLTTQNEKLVRDTLGELMTAGHKPEEVPVPEKKKYTPPTQETFTFYEGLRAWVRANGQKNRAGTGWAYQTNKTLQYYYPLKLRREYQAYLDSKESKGE